MTNDMQPVRRADRLAGLRRFAVAITVLNILGHTVLGFEQPLIAPFVGLAAAYATELLLEWADAALNQRRPRFAGGVRPLVDSLLSAHISGLAVAMLLYSNSRMWPIAFAAVAAISSKSVVSIPGPHGRTHFFNPSNFGISLTLLLFGWVSIAPPYHFTEDLNAAGRIGLPLLIIGTGSFLNARFTHRVPVIAGWLGAFVLQAVVRSAMHDTPVAAALLPMTGVAFILFTFYMVTDPATTPATPRAQLAFGASTAILYGLLVNAHIVFGLFFSLSLTCAVRAVYAVASAWNARRVTAPSLVLRPATSDAIAPTGATQ